MVCGATPACLYVRQACERDQKDEAASAKRRYPYVFDASKAERACNFIETLVHVKGRWAVAKDKHIRLEPWQCFIVCMLFGWVRKRDGLRRFREAYIEVPRKNGKSLLAAAIGLYMLLSDGEHGAEVYSGATTEKQAWEVFTPARQMLLRTPYLAAHYGATVGAKNLHVEDVASKFEPLIGNPGDGSSPHCAIVDEYHEHQTDRLHDTMMTGMGARSQPLLLAITTAGSSIEGPCYQKRTQAIRILSQAEGFINEEFFTVIYTIDQGDDWQDFATWRKANPNIDVSVSEEFLMSRHRDAMQLVGRRNAILTKNLNVWQSVGTAWCDLPAWDRCQSEKGIADLDGCDSWLGVDLASRSDIAALIHLFRDSDGHYYVFCRSYLPEDTIHQPQNEHYRRWKDEGWVTETDGEIIDLDVIEAEIARLAMTHGVQLVAYDPWQATQMATHLQAVGVPVVEVGATVKNFSEPMKELGSLIARGMIHHDGNPCLRWMMANVVAKPDAKENIYPRKERNESKIDGVVALLMALGRAMMAGPTASPDVDF